MEGAPQPAAGRRLERLRKSERLRRRADYQRCYRQGRRQHGSLLVLHVLANNLDRPRLGITVSKKVGSSVVRHRVKRRVKEIYRRWEKRPHLPAVDLVVHLRPEAAQAAFSDIRRDLGRLLERVLRP